MLTQPCAQCPWRRANHGKRHFAGFYTKRNLRRLWNQIRRGGGRQSCHITDPGHPDHVRAGAKEDRGKKKPEECFGSLIIVQRELRRRLVGDGDGDTVMPEDIDRYISLYSRRGLTKMGLAYYLLSRQMDPPFGDGRMMLIPDAILDDPAYGLPKELQVTPQ